MTAESSNAVPPLVLTIDVSEITNAESFHRVFAKALGFPDFYGRNMDAWIDCMSCLDDPQAGLTSIHVVENSMLCLQFESVTEFRKRCPEQYADLIECSAFVNWSRIEIGLAPILALSFPG